MGGMDMKKTRADNIVEWLVSKGCKEIKSRSKYRQFSIPDRTSFYFVGKNGALRAGKNASESVSLTHTLKKVLV